MNKIIITIDGFSSCGKSTMAKSLAHQIGYVFIDSGAMYRAITLYSIENNIINNDVIDEQRLKNEIDNINISFIINTESGLPETLLNGYNVEKQIRSMDVSNQVSKISSIAFVRETLVKMQQQMGAQKGIVMDGRDIGTVVFPNAELKIFVTASPQVRAQRRFDELQAKGDTKITYNEVLQNLTNRDYLDQNRKESPLRQAKDALTLDNTHMTMKQQMEWLLDKYNQIIRK